MCIQTAIDGFRVIAERSGTYAGQSEPEFYYQNSTLSHCKIRVYRWHNESRYEAAVGVAYWNEYAASGMWNKMPHNMLSKVAEALALRKAFPQDLSGLYTTEEMQQAGATDVEVEVIQENVNSQVMQAAMQPQQQEPQQLQAAPVNTISFQNAAGQPVGVYAQQGQQQPQQQVQQAPPPQQHGPVPILPKQFEQALARIQNGEIELYGNVKNTYILTEDQDRLLKYECEQASKWVSHIQQKFDQPEQIVYAMELCRTATQLSTVFANNNLIIERSPELRQKFEQLKATLK